MQGRYLFFLFLLTALPLSAAPSREGIALQELRIALQEYSYNLHSHKTEIDILHEKLQNLEKSITSLKTTLSQQGHSASPIEKRVATLEQGQQTLISDLKQLKGHINETSTKLASIDKQLKTSLKSMVSMLQPQGAGGEYIVKVGDSLGQIALDHKISIKHLKELNQLPNDRIFVGQKLRLSE